VSKEVYSVTLRIRVCMLLCCEVWHTNTTKTTNIFLSFQKSLVSWSAYLVKLQFIFPARPSVHKNLIEVKSVVCNIARICR